MKRRLLRAGMWLAGVALLGAVIVLSGVIPIAASSGHWTVTAWLLHFTMRRSVATHSAGTEVPPLDDRRLVLMGAGHYDGVCRSCHGSPGEARSPIAEAMTPDPPELTGLVGRYDDAELFYIVRHGVKFTGMPAWPAPDRDDEVWAVVAFLRVLPNLDGESYRALALGEEARDAPSVVAVHCARCHGSDGRGREQAFPSIAGQRPAYMRTALEAYASGDRYSGIMQPIAAALSDDEMEAAVAWYAGRSPAAGAGTAPGSLGEALAQRGIPARRIPACVDCHGPSSEPRHEGYPRLEGQYAHYLERQLDLFARGARGGGPYVELMQSVSVHALEDEEIRALARYFEALPRDQAEAP